MYVCVSRVNSRRGMITHLTHECVGWHIIVIALVEVYDYTCCDVYIPLMRCKCVHSYFALFSAADNRCREVSPMPGTRRAGRKVLIGNVQMSQQLTGGGREDPINVNTEKGLASRVRDSVVGNSKDGRSDLRIRPDKQRSEGGRSESARRRPLASRKAVKRPEVRRPRPIKTKKDSIAVSVFEDEEWKEDDEMGCLGAIPTEPIVGSKPTKQISTAAKEKKEIYLK